MKGENRGDGVSIGIREQADGGTEGDEEEGKRGEGGGGRGHKSGKDAMLRGMEDDRGG